MTNDTSVNAYNNDIVVCAYINVIVRGGTIHVVGRYKPFVCAYKTDMGVSACSDGFDEGVYCYMAVNANSQRLCCALFNAFQAETPTDL